MRPLGFQLRQPLVGDWQEPNARAAARRRKGGETSRVLYAEALVSLQRRPVSAEAQRVFARAPADQARKV
jgi:hypothetical protein